MKYIAVLMLLSSVSWADMSECNMKKDPDEKNWCMASYSGSAGFCDKIKNGERKRECISKVIKMQRQSTYGVPKPPQKEKDKK